MKVQVSERALLRRINRRLEDKLEEVCKCAESSQWHSDLGDYYCVDQNLNTVIAQHIDLEAWGRELGALKPHEEMAQTEPA
ncbi:hypothetical protein [uncultured Microbulbifer sp.]|uniref:hypothetical protein n=1 Tax=uncultured Microbulbifer sp. TaxID=348147 RepID=UPI002627F3CA|nr:hypothetical protein [uncultured Microbulbifer sp.]